MDRFLKFFAPPQLADKDQTLRARHLHHLLWAAIGVTMVIGLIDYVTGIPTTLPLMLGGQLILVGAHELNKQGRIFTASVIFVVLNLVLLTTVLSIGQGIHDLAIVVYPIMIAIASFLMGQRGLILTIILVLSSVSYLILGEYYGVLPLAPRFSPAQPSDILVMSAFIFMAAITMGMLVGALEQAVQEARRHEQALHTSEEQYRRAIAAIGAVPYVRDDLTKSYTFMGEGIYDMLGYTPAEMTPALMNSLIEENHMVGELAELSVPEAIRLVHERQIQTWRSDSRLRTRRGEQRWVNDRSVQIYDAAQRWTGAIGVLQDVTERKLIEEQLRASLGEKEILIKEVHHRVKNNLQVIVSILNLQAAYVSDPALLSILRDSQARVRAMALVHEKLYRAANLAQIDFHDYLQHLVTALLRSDSPYTSQIDLTVDMDPVTLSAETALPCGLLVSELITNVLKHAFPHQHPGRVAVRLRQNENGQLGLTIEDNGAGFPDGQDWRHMDTLGMQLVQSLVQQIHGTIEMTRLTPGTSFTIQFSSQA